MAKAENWTKNQKYRSMPEQLLRYRSATFLIRLYCPEVMVGVPAQVEVELDMKDVTPADVLDKYWAGTVADEVAEAEVVSKSAAEEPKADTGAAPNSDADFDQTERHDAPDPEQFQKLGDMIANDLMDSPDVEGGVELYQDQIEKMEVAAPQAHKRLMETVAEFRNAEG